MFNGHRGGFNGRDGRFGYPPPPPFGRPFPPPSDFDDDSQDDDEFYEDDFDEEEDYQDDFDDLDSNVPPPPPPNFPPNFMGGRPPRGFSHFPPNYPPRPFAGGVPPMGDFPRGAAFDSRGRFINLDESADKDFSSPENFEDEQDFIDEEGLEDAEPVSSIDKRDCVALMHDAELDKLRLSGLQTARVNRNIESNKQILSAILSLVFFILAIASVVFASFLGYKYFKSEQSKAAQEKTDSAVAAEDSEMKSDDLSGWGLKDSQLNDILGAFYSSIGQIDKIAESVYILQRGYVEIGGKSEEFHCIKKPTGEAYLRLGLGKGERAYLITSFETSSQRLYNGTLSGRKADLSIEEELPVRALSAFDEVIFLRAFSRVSLAARIPLQYDGKAEINSVSCNVISVKEERGNDLLYYFNSQTKLLDRLVVNNGSSTVQIDFSDYSIGDEFYHFPRVREISVNGKPFAKVTVDFVVSNRWMFFPR